MTCEQSQTSTMNGATAHPWGTRVRHVAFHHYNQPEPTVQHPPLSFAGIAIVWAVYGYRCFIARHDWIDDSNDIGFSRWLWGTDQVLVVVLDRAWFEFGDRSFMMTSLFVSNKTVPSMLLQMMSIFFSWMWNTLWWVLWCDFSNDMQFSRSYAWCLVFWSLHLKHF